MARFFGANRNLLRASAVGALLLCGIYAASDKAVIRRFVTSHLNQKVALNEVRQKVTGKRLDALCSVLSEERNPYKVLRILDFMETSQGSALVSNTIIEFFEREEPWDSLSKDERRVMAMAKVGALSSLGLTRTDEAKNYLEKMVFSDGLAQLRPQEGVGEAQQLSSAGTIGILQGNAAFGLCLMGSEESRDKVRDLRAKKIALVQKFGNPQIYDESLPDEIQSAVHLISASSSGLAGYDAIEELGLDGYLRLRIEDPEGFEKMMPYHFRHHVSIFGEELSGTPPIVIR